MRVMKFISVAAILVMISALAVAQQTPAQSSPTVNHALMGISSCRDFV